VLRKRPGPRELGIEVKYIEVQGGNHSDIVVPNLPAAFEFFDRHPKSRLTTEQ
jgi:hypothetical protein